MTGLETVTLPDGTTRRLGCILPKAGLTRAFPVYGDAPATPMIPRSQWADVVAKFAPGPAFPFLPYVHDQDGVGQCNCDATAAAVESVRMSQGLPFVKLSAADLYDRINGGSDNGSLLEDAMHEMLTAGIGTAESVGATIWRRGMRTAPAAERARFKALEVFVCPTFDHQFSAVAAGFRVVSGVMWYDSYKPGADGWLPRGGGGGGGHAIFGFKPAARNGQYGVWHRQSWGESWSPQTDNCFVISEDQYRGEVGGWWAIRGVVDEGGVIPGGN